MKKLLLSLFFGYGVYAQTVVTQVVYVTNTVIVQSQPIVYPGQSTVVQPVVVQQPPTVIYEPAPVIVSPVFAPWPYYYYRSYPRYYHYGPAVHVGVRFGHR